MFYFIYKGVNRILNIIEYCFFTLVTKIILKGNNVCFKGFRTYGYPVIIVSHGGQLQIGDNFSMNNLVRSNPIGAATKNIFFVGKSAKLKIGNNVGISQSAIVCHELIIIGDHVKIGGGVKIYDTDFHSLDPEIRKSKSDLFNKKTMPIIIEENVFIGAFSIVLKGVTIGKNSIIGAGSIVTKSIPSNEIWAGNPAAFIRKI